MNNELFEKLISQVKEEPKKEFFYNWACDIISLMPEERLDYMDWNFMLDSLSEYISENDNDKQ